MCVNLHPYTAGHHAAADGWYRLARCRASNARAPQKFALPEQARGAWVHYLQVRMLSHYGKGGGGAG